MLLPVRNERHGGSTGPSYATDSYMRARNRCQAWLERHFEIVEGPLEPVLRAASHEDARQQDARHKT